MKKIGIISIAICGLLLVSGTTYGQSLKDILKSSTVKDAITSVTGGSKLTAESLQGTWTYVNPALQLKGDNALKNIAGSVASSELEKKLSEYCRRRV